MTKTHRQRMEVLLGRSLLPTEFVHHVDGNQNHNHIENLQLVTPSEHRHLHPRRRQRICVVCNGDYSFLDGNGHLCPNCGGQPRPIFKGEASK